MEAQGGDAELPSEWTSVPAINRDAELKAMCAKPREVLAAARRGELAALRAVAQSQYLSPTPAGFEAENVIPAVCECVEKHIEEVDPGTREQMWCFVFDLLSTTWGSITVKDRGRPTAAIRRLFDRNMILFLQRLEKNIATIDPHIEGACAYPVSDNRKPSRLFLASFGCTMCARWTLEAWANAPRAAQAIGHVAGEVGESGRVPGPESSIALQAFSLEVANGLHSLFNEPRVRGAFSADLQAIRGLIALQRMTPDDTSAVLLLEAINELGRGSQPRNGGPDEEALDNLVRAGAPAHMGYVLSRPDRHRQIQGPADYGHVMPAHVHALTLSANLLMFGNETARLALWKAGILAPALLKLCTGKQQEQQECVRVLERMLPDLEGLREYATDRSTRKLLAAAAERPSHLRTTLRRASTIVSMLAAAEEDVAEEGQGQARHVCHRAACGKLEGDGTRFSLCSGCKAVRYCSRACQKADWKIHKARCQSSVSEQQKGQPTGSGKNRLAVITHYFKGHAEEITAMAEGMGLTLDRVVVFVDWADEADWRGVSGPKPMLLDEAGNALEELQAIGTDDDPPWWSETQREKIEDTFAKRKEYFAAGNTAPQVVFVFHFLDAIVTDRINLDFLKKQSSEGASTLQAAPGAAEPAES